MTDDVGTFTHELGHAIVGLADEYAETQEPFPDSLAPFSFFPFGVGDQLPETPNLSLNPSGSKWRGLVEGAQEGGARYGKGIYHPTGNCMMLNAHSEFCPVCSDAVDRTLAARAGENDGPPLISVGLMEPPNKLSMPLDGILGVFDRNGLASVVVTLDGQDLTPGFAPNGPGWRYDTTFGQEGSLQGAHELEITATDGLGLSVTQTIALLGSP